MHCLPIIWLMGASSSWRRFHSQIHTRTATKINVRMLENECHNESGSEDKIHIYIIVSLPLIISEIYLHWRCHHSRVHSWCLRCFRRSARRGWRSIGGGGWRGPEINWPEPVHKIWHLREKSHKKVKIFNMNKIHNLTFGVYLEKEGAERQ